MKTLYRIIGITLLVGILALIRYFGDRLFYDPLTEFYKSDYLREKVPDLDKGRLLLHAGLRFWSNSIISLAIIYVGFLDRNIVKFSFVLYILLFLVCFTAFTYLIFRIENEHSSALFYVRRFLIQPLFVIILLPAFYYYRLRSRRINRKHPGRTPEIS
jgi:exosortase F-associated protein